MVGAQLVLAIDLEGRGMVGALIILHGPRLGVSYKWR
jgi:hypothetical protein